MKRLWFVCLFLLVVPQTAAAEPWMPLYQRVDQPLQAALTNLVNGNAKWRRLAQRKRLGVCVVDLSSDPPRFARVNGNEMMYAASLPKIAILLSAYMAVERGDLTLDESLRTDLDAMIRVSSNDAATRVLDRIGMTQLNKDMRDPALQLYDTTRGGGLWVGKRYAKAGTRVGDPLHGISHGATPTQVCRFYYLAATGRLISPQRSKQILSHLVDPGLHHKFVSQLDRVAPKAKIYRKSGTWQDFHSDSVLVRGTQWRDYILVGLVQANDGEEVLRKLLLSVEDVLHPA